LFKPFTDWIDDRTGFRALLHEALAEKIPGGARWRYVFGSALSVVFMIQVFTGLLLMTSYSPSSSMAWASVFYISHDMWYGWFIRGVHHFAAQAMVVLLALHLLQVLWAGAYRRPREFNWWFGMVLLFLTLAFSLTGYLLPWDQKGYWATKVATNIMGGAPGIGPYLQKVVVGGSDYGNQTVTRFYGLHVGVLPALLVVFLAGHIALFRRHGITPPRGHEKRATALFWPEQLFMDTVFSAAVVGVVIVLVLAEGGANLDAPADPSSSDYPARPEWYFLSLFQMLKYFPGKREMIGTIVIPTVLLVVMLILPLLDKVLPGKFAHFLACGFVFAVLGGAGYMTVQAMWDDSRDPVFQEARKKADATRERALLLAGSPEAGIPPDGSAYILRRDPLTHGRAALERRCLGCHVDGGKGSGTQTASDLAGFGSRAWIRGLLENPQAPAYFGKVPPCDGMAQWKESSKLKGTQLDEIADFVASFARIPADMTPAEWLKSPGVSGHPALKVFRTGGECGECHVLAGLSKGGLREAPDLFAWGSPQWIARMIRKPTAADRYGFLEEEQKMPAFGPDQLPQIDLEMVIRYLQGDYVKGGASPLVEKSPVGQPITPAKSP
jgi:quinol-cytochrome oxidoreductase complex cytochrome b subunit/mono/diheme cytochrome c family protein